MSQCLQCCEDPSWAPHRRAGYCSERSRVCGGGIGRHGRNLTGAGDGRDAVRVPVGGPEGQG
eukprot:261180-Lingulodinium_polyedra.AAC.1